MTSSSSSSSSSEEEAPANVRVLVRVRPPNDSERRGGSSSAVVLRGGVAPMDFGNGGGGSGGDGTAEGSATVTVNDNVGGGGGYDSDSVHSRAGGGSGSGGGGKTFVFDAVHGPRSTQSDVFESVKGIVDCVASGYNGTIVAYGQTGSGKTHTVFGSGGCESESAGLVQRSLKALFRSIAMSQAEDAAAFTGVSTEGGGDRPIRETTARASFFEIFNERVYDLLSGDSLEAVLPVREDSVRGVYVDGLREVEVADTAEAEAILARGNANRQVASTSMNRTSSRSHAVFVLTVRSVFTSGDGAPSRVRTSKFTLVDLAGSERQRSTNAAGERLKEASSINTSLLTLGNVINALVDREAGRESRHVPFRDSKLTFLLRDSWGGNSKTCLVATISPSMASASETLSTLKFAQRAKLIRNTAVLNEDTTYGTTVAALQAEVSRLRSQLQNAASAPSRDPLATSGVSSDRAVAPRASSGAPDPSPNGGNDAGIIVSVVERRARRAEGKVAALAKQLSRKEEVVKSLKRKLEEEHLVRKFKQRRIEYLSKTKDGPGADASLDVSEEIDALRGEVEALRRQIDAPCPDAINFKVKYERVKEELEEERANAGAGATFDQSERQSLEDVINTLTDEKHALEEKVAEISSSSSQTQKEIDEILQEVSRLEADMESQKDQLRSREEEVWVANESVSAAEAKKDELQSELETTKEELSQATTEVAHLRKSLEELQKTIDRLTNEMKEKMVEMADIEAAHTRTADELRSKIQELSKRLEESNMASDDKAVAELEVREHLAAASKDNSILVQRVKLLQQEKDNAIDLAENKLKETESVMKSKLNALEAEKQSLSSEISKLEKAAEESRKEAEATAAVEINDLKAAIREIEGRVQTVQDDKAALIKKMEDAAREKEVSLNAKVQALEEEKQSLDSLLASLKVEADQTESKAKAALANEVSRHESQVAELKGTIESLISEKEMSVSDALQRLEKAEASLGANVKLLEEEKANLLEQISELKKALVEANEKEAFSSEERKRNEDALVETRNTINELERRIQSLLEDKDTAVDEGQRELDEAKASFTSRIQELEAERNELVIMKTAAEEAEARAETEAKDQRINHEQAVKDLEKRISDAEAAKNEAIKDAHNEHAKAKAFLEAKVESLEGEKCKLSQQLDELKTVVDDSMANADAKSAASAAELDAMRATVREMQEKIDSVQEEKERSINEVRSELQSALDRKDSEIEDAIAKSEATACKLGSLQKEKDELSQKIAAMEALVDESKASAEAVSLEATEEVNGLKAKLAEMEECLAKKDEEIEQARVGMQASFDVKDKESDAARLKFEAMEAQYNLTLKEMEEKVALVNTERETTTNDMQTKLTRSEAECQAWKEQATLWERSAEDAKARTQGLNDKIKLAQRAKSSLEFELDTLREDQDSLNEQVRLLHDRNDELEQENVRLSKLLQDGGTLSGEGSTPLAANNSSPAPNDDPASPQPIATPFRDLSSRMDVVLNRMSEAKPPTDEADGSFDEDMFLPNAESPPCNKELSFLGPVANDTIDKENVTPFKAQSSIMKKALSTRKGNGTPCQMESSQKKLPLSARKKTKTPHKTPSVVKKYPKVMSETKHRTGWSSNLKMK